MIQIENLSPMLRMTDAEIDKHIAYGVNGNRNRLTPMLRMTNAEIDSYLNYGLNGFSRRRVFNKREIRREECQYERYADDWERGSDAN